MERVRKRYELFKYLTSAAILGLSILVAAVLVVARKKPEKREQQQLIPMVRTTSAEPFSGKLNLKLNGIVTPHREITVSSQVKGRIEQKHGICCAGAYVKKGTELLRIDPTDYDLQIERLNAEVEQSQNRIAEIDNEIDGNQQNRVLIQEERDVAKREYDRRKDLRSSLSQSELDTARRSFLTAEKALTSINNTLSLLVTRKKGLQSAIQLSKAILKQAEEDKNRTVILAPSDGVLVRDLVEEGDFVQIGTQLLLFEDIAKAEVLCNLRVDQLDWILQNQIDQTPSGHFDPSMAYQLPETNVSITAKIAGEIVEWSGRLIRFDGVGLDERTKTIPVRILVDQPVALTKAGRRALVRGMYVGVNIQIDTGNLAATGREFLSFPAVAVQPGNYVWTVENERLHSHRVNIVNRMDLGSGDDVVPTVVVEQEPDGVAAGDKIVISPLSQPTEEAFVLEEGATAQSGKPDDENAAESELVSGSDDDSPSNKESTL